MTDAELEVLLADLASDRVERKSSASDHEKIRETVCAFANDLPNHRLAGVIFVGVKDDGSSAGLSITDELLNALAGIRDEGKTAGSFQRFRNHYRHGLKRSVRRGH